MNKLVTHIGAVAIGVVLGYVAGSRCSKQYYEQKTREAVESVKRAYAPQNKEQPELVLEDADAPKDTPAPPEPSTGTEEIERKEEPIMARSEPYEISPQEFGHRKGYQFSQLIAFADNIISDEEGRVIDEDSILGEDIFDILERAEGDPVYIRDDSLKHDYEVVQDDRDYEDVSFPEPFDPEDL